VNGPHGAPPFAGHSQLRSALPPELLYVTGGQPLTRHPFIEAFNAEDTSSSPQPIYTISPIDGGSYGYFAVDANNDLFAVNYFANGAKLIAFPSGKIRPIVNCLLDNKPQGMYADFHTLYLATPTYTIEEYKLPIRRGYACPKPNAVLTDQRAKLRGIQGVWSPAVDRNGDVFDVWYHPIGSSLGPAEIDVFPAGSKNARRFVGLPESSGLGGLLSTSSGDLVTNRGSRREGQTIAVFVRSSHTLKVFHHIPSGGYFGFARGNAGTELFASRDYPITEVVVYAFDLKTGDVGRVLRSFTSVWRNAGSIAVFSR
jgi:hypothetical protein